MRLRGLAAMAVACLFAWTGAASAAPALWVVRDADSEIYLFGALHALSPQTAWKTPAYEAAYDRAATVWFEADLDSLDPEGVQALVRRYGVDPERPLSQKLSRAELRSLKPLLARGHMNLAAIDHLRPWAAALMLSMQPALEGGAEIEAGADLVVTRDARRAAKTVRTFETLEDQARMFAGLPEPVEVQYLNGVVRDRRRPARVAEGGVPLETAWLAGDLDRLGLVEALASDNPAFHDMLITRRNTAWAEALAREMAGAGVQLVNVGALHLIGEAGLPALMKARGYTVERIQ